MPPISTVSRTLFIAATAIIMAVAFAGAFGAGFVAQLHREALDPGAAPAEMLVRADAIETAMGHTGFLPLYRSGAETAALQQQIQKARSALTELQRLAGPYPGARAAADAAAGILSTFESAAIPEPASRPAVAEMESAYATLRMETARLRQTAGAARLDALGIILTWSQWVIGAAVALLALGFIAMAAFLSARVTGPLRQLYVSVASAGQGNFQAPVWGTDRTDEIGSIARAADKLRTAVQDTSQIAALAKSGPLRVKLEGPSAVLFEHMTAALQAATGDLAAAAQAAARSGHAAQDGLQSASQRFAAAAAELAGFTAGARSEVREAADALRSAASGVAASGQHAETHLLQLTSRFAQSGDHVTAAAAQVSERVTTALAELAAASEGLRIAAQEARANQSTATTFAQQAAGQTAEALGLLQSAGLNLTATLSSMEDRMARAFQSVARLTDSLTASASSLSAASEESMRRLASAAKDLEGRSAQAELRLGLALDEAGQQAKASAKESAQLKAALAQALDDLRTTRAGLETAHGAQGADLSHVLSALQDLQSLLVHQSAEPPSRAAAAAETLAMQTPLRAITPYGAAKFPIAAADMLARLGSIAAEVRAAAGHEMPALRGLLLAAADAAQSDAPPPQGWPGLAAQLLSESAALGVPFEELARGTAALAERCAGFTGDPGAAERAAVAAEAQTLLDLADSAEALALPEAKPRTLRDTLEAAATDIQRLSDVIAELELRTETIAQGAEIGAPDVLLSGVPDDVRLRTDEKTDEAIQAVFQSIERLNNIAQALARAGDLQRNRLAGE